LGCIILDIADHAHETGEGWVARLERELGANWTAIRKAQITTEEKRASLRLAFEGESQQIRALSYSDRSLGKR